MREYTEQDAEKAVKGYAVYLRKSQQDLEAEKRGEMETLARHEKIINGLVEEQGLTVTKVYKEIVSGETIQDRPQMQEMMREVYAGKYTGVIVVKPDRLSRGDLENMGYIMNGLKFSGTLLVTPGMTYDVANNKFHEQMLEMQLFNSKQEYRAITARMTEGKMLSIREGNFFGTYAPYGYDIDTPDRWTRTLKPNANAEIVVKIFEWFANDKMSVGDIRTKLFSLGILTSRGNRDWHRASLKEILKNPIYTGKNVWYKRKTSRELDENGVIIKRNRRTPMNGLLTVPGKHPAIISEELFEAAQARFCGNTSNRIGFEIVNPLAGLLRCSNCGRVMCYNQKTSTANTTRFAHPNSKTCFMKSSVDEDVMELVVKALKAYIADFEFKVTSAGRDEEIERHASEVAMIKKELDKANAKRRKLFDDYEEGVYTPAEFKERKAVWADRIENLHDELERLKANQPNEVDYAEKAFKFKEALDAIQNPETPAKTVNHLLKEIIERIDYSCEDLGRRRGGVITLDFVLKK